MLKPLLSVSRKEKISVEKFYAFDSTTITLFSDVMKGVGRNLGRAKFILPISVAE